MNQQMKNKKRDELDGYKLTFATPPCLRNYPISKTTPFADISLLD